MTTWIAAATMVLAVGAAHAQAAGATESCPVTLPNGRGLPTEAPAPYLYGNDALSTALDIHGTTYTFEHGGRGPGIILPDGSLRWPKIGFRRGIRGRLTVEGRRLDGVSPPLRPEIPDGYGEIGFQVLAVVFPSPGCWELTARVADRSLTMVVNVVVR